MKKHNRNDEQSSQAVPSLFANSVKNMREKFGTTSFMNVTKTCITSCDKQVQHPQLQLRASVPNSITGTAYLGIRGEVRLPGLASPTGAIAMTAEVNASMRCMCEEHPYHDEPPSHLNSERYPPFASSNFRFSQNDANNTIFVRLHFRSQNT